MCFVVAFFLIFLPLGLVQMMSEGGTASGVGVLPLYFIHPQRCCETERGRTHPFFANALPFTNTEQEQPNTCNVLERFNAAFRDEKFSCSTTFSPRG